MLAARSSPPALLSVALALGARTYPRLGLRRGVERYVREHNPRWRLLQKFNHTHLEWQDAMASEPDALIGFFEDASQFDWVKQHGVVAVNMHRVPGCEGLAEVLVDDPAVGRTAARYFLGKGFRRFAYCTHAPRKGFSEDRRAGFGEELAKAGWEAGFITIDASGPVISGDLSKLLNSAHEDRIAVFCCDDACGGFLTRLCREAGLRIPGDLVILGAGDDAFHVENDSVTLSSVKIDFPAVGYQAAAMMDALLKGSAVPEEALRVSFTGITERSSTASDTESPALRRLLRLIEERHADPEFTPVIAARLCKVSSRTLRRYLKEADRPSFSDLLRDRRLETAMQSLVATEDPVERISEISGFLDYTTFFRAFRRRYGMSPTDCRRKAEIRPMPYLEEKGLKARSA
ncbi:MAG: hypothetical protein JWO82_4403 [Akkermansiaceae bacterium]|nr:hypothetical protein [Akkermansiaceae bacterium]